MARRIALFITCLTDQFYPRTGIAITRILEKLGYEVDFPFDQTCCGQPFFNNGFMNEAGKLAKRLIEIFEPYEQIITPSASCAAMVREQFKELFAHDAQWKPRSDAIEHKTYEFVEFLTKVAGFDPRTLTLPNGESFTYHYTCHQRGLGLKSEAVDVLKSIGGVDYRPLEKADQCCGFGGTFAIKYPSISESMVDDKMKNIAATGANVTICNDAGCTMNIAGMCNRHGVKMRVTHLAEVIAQAMGIELPELG